MKHLGDMNMALCPVSLRHLLRGGLYLIVKQLGTSRHRWDLSQELRGSMIAR